jgi:type IV pilus assembly protein PilB
MATDKLPGYLRPVPGPEAAAADVEAEDATTNGITAPMRRGNSGMFITDVIVELGYAPRERVEEVINEARVAGKSPETLLRDYKVVDSDQLSRAVAERCGLDHIDLNVYKVDMGAANLLSVSAARR